MHTCFTYRVNCFIHHCMVIRQLHESNIVLLRKDNILLDVWDKCSNISFMCICYRLFVQKCCVNISDPDNLPPSVSEWLNSLHLGDKTETFMNKNFDTMDRVMKLWEVELISVLDITAVGHRKRILASLEHRKKPDRQFTSLVRQGQREITPALLCHILN